MYRSARPLPLLVLFAIALSTTYATAAPVACDVNNSGTVDAVDVQLTVNKALGIPNSFNTNVDRDPGGFTNAIDVQLVVNAVLGLVVDSDGDGLTNAAEANLGTNPNVFDTDGGGEGDGQEILNGTNPLSPADDGGATGPTAAFTANVTSGVAPLTVQFTDQSIAGSSPITSWLWNFGDTQTSTQQNPSHQYTNSGTYSVSLRVATAAGNNTLVKDGYITVTPTPQEEVFWISELDGNWNDPNNWSTGKVPTANQKAIVNMPNRTVTVFVPTSLSIANAEIEENLTVSNGTLTETGVMVVNGTFSITGTGALFVNGAGASFTANGPAVLDNHTVSVRNGGSVTFPSLTTYNFTSPANPTIFDVANTGSVLSCPNLTSLNFNVGSSSFVTARLSSTDNGMLELPKLQTVTLGTNHRFTLAVGSGGGINADMLTAVSGLGVEVLTGSTLSLPALTSLTNSNSTVEGTLNAPNVTSLVGSNVTLRSAATVNLANLSTINTSSLTMQGTASAVLPSLTSLQTTNLTMQNSASLSLPALTSYSSTNSSTYLWVNNSATLNAPNLAGITNVILYTRSGGVINLPAVTSYTWNVASNPTALDASGAGSQVILGALTTLVFNIGSSSFITLRILSDSGAQVQLPSLLAPALGTNHKYTLAVTGGGTITADALDAGTSLNVEVGTGSTLTLPSILTLTSNNITVDGTFNIPNTTSVSGASMTFRGTANGNLNSLASLGTSSLTLQDSVALNLPNLTTLQTSNVTLRNSANLSLPELTSVSATNTTTYLSLYNSSILSAPKLASLTNVNLYVRNGAALNLLAVTSYTWNLAANPTVFDVANTGSTINLPALATLVFNIGSSSFITLRMLADDSGHLSIPALHAPVLGTNHRYAITLSNGGSIDASGLDSALGLNLTVGTGSSISLPGVASFMNNTVSIDGSFTAANATAMTGSTVTFQNNATVSLPSLTSIGTSSLTAKDSVNVSLPEVTSLQSTNVTVQNTASLTLAKLTSYSSTNTTTYLSVYNTGTFSAPELLGLTNIILYVRQGGDIILPKVATYTWNLAANPTAFDASGLGSLISLPLLTNLTFNIGSSSFITLRVLSDSSANIELPALQTTTMGTNHRYTLAVTSGGTMNISALQSAASLNIEVGTSSLLTLPAVTNLTSNNATVDGTLNLPLVTSITGSTLTFRGTGGGNFGGVSSMTTSSLTVQDNASVSLPALTTLATTNLTLRNNGAVSLPLLTSASSTNTTTYFSVYDAGGLSAPLLASLTNINLYVRSGGTINLPSLTTYTWNLAANPTAFDAANSGSKILVPSLDTIVFNIGASSFITLRIQADSAAAINLAGLTTVTLGTNHRYAIAVTNGGTVTTNALASLSGVNLTTDTSSSLAFPSVTSITNTNLTMSGALSLPGLTSIQSSSLTINGTGSMSAPLLSSMTNVSSLTLRDNVSVSLPGLTTLQNTSLTVRENASLTLAGLTSYTATNTTTILFVSNNGVFSAAALTSITSVTIQVRTGATLTLPALTTYNWNQVTNPTALDASEANSLLSLPSLTTINFNIGASNFITLRVSSTAGGRISLPALTTITLGTNHSLQFQADGANSQVSIPVLGALPPNVTTSATNGGVIITSKKLALKSGLVLEEGTLSPSTMQADLDGDGVNDLLTLDTAGGGVRLRLGGRGVMEYPVGAQPVAMALADLDADGDLDLVVANYESLDVSVLEGLGDGTFASESVVPVKGAPLKVTSTGARGSQIAIVTDVHGAKTTITGEALTLK